MVCNLRMSSKPPEKDVTLTQTPRNQSGQYNSDQSLELTKSFKVKKTINILLFSWFYYLLSCIFSASEMAFCLDSWRLICALVLGITNNKHEARKNVFRKIRGLENINKSQPHSPHFHCSQPGKQNSVNLHW